MDSSSLIKERSESHYLTYKVLEDMVDFFVLIEYFDNRNIIQISYFKIDADTQELTGHFAIVRICKEQSRLKKKAGEFTHSINKNRYDLD